MASLSVYASPGRYVQGRDATAQLGSQMKACGLESPVLILGDPVVIPMLESVWASTLPDLGYEYHVVSFGGECTAEEIDGLIAEGRRISAKTVVGCGGGKVLDTARGAADQLNAHVVNCPSAASTDAPCSALSVVYKSDGSMDHYRFYKSHPHLVLLDTSVICKAPKRLLVSGMGDALATWFEARAVSASGSDNMLQGGCTQAGLALAKLCFDTLMAEGEAACAAVEAQVVTPALEKIVEANTLLSGLGFECGGLAVAHALHNGLTQAPGAHKMLHGEKVAFGTVTQLVLEGRPREELDQVYGFCCRVGLPVTLEQVGVDASDHSLLMAVAERTTQEGETAHNEPFKVTALAVKDAMLAADVLGKEYLAKAGKA